MQRIHLAVCDDESYYIEEIQKLLYRYSQKKEYAFFVDTYMSGEMLLERLETKHYDVFLLDVDMPGIKGTDLGKEIHRQYPQAVICFVTSYQEYAYEAYQTEALGYLVKPVEYTAIKRLLDRSIEQLEFYKEKEQQENSILELKSGRGTAWINTKEIVYIEKKKNQCIFHMDKDDIAIYITLSEVYTMLDGTLFYYVHQGCIVNFSKILEVRKRTIYLKGNIEISVSRKYQPIIRELHIEKIMQMGNR